MHYQPVYDGQEDVLPWEISIISKRVTFQNDLSSADEYDAIRISTPRT
jgi:hypothetical protein